MGIENFNTFAPAKEKEKQNNPEQENTPEQLEALKKINENEKEHQGKVKEIMEALGVAFKNDRQKVKNNEVMSIPRELITVIIKGVLGLAPGAYIASLDDHMMIRFIETQGRGYIEEQYMGNHALELAIIGGAAAIAALSCVLGRSYDDGAIRRIINIFKDTKDQLKKETN